MALKSETPMPNLDKVGNLVIYLVDEIQKKHRQRLYLTKLLKLLYIIDETSVKETGAPVTGLEYRVWKMGPVAFDVYKDLRHENSDKLSIFAEAKKGEGEAAQIASVNKFDDSEFSDYEIELIDRIIDQFGYYQKDDLIKLLHEEGSLWKKIVDEQNLEKKFEKDNTSSYKIDLSELVADDPYKLSVFKTAQESLKL
ncbi:MAG: SocA family protein [Cytophagales bacterium]|nr:SocA family protein [Cytophagales bacterium]